MAWPPKTPSPIWFPLKGSPNSSLPKPGKVKIDTLLKMVFGLFFFGTSKVAIGSTTSKLKLSFEGKI